MLKQAVLVLLVVGGARVAAADEDAKALYKKAETAFALGHFNDAAELFERVFELKQDPVLLYDAAQSHRLAGNKQKALVLYQNYLRMYGERDNAVEVEKRVAELKAAIEAERTANTNPPTGLLKDKAEPPGEKPETPPPPATTTPPATAIVAAPPPPPSKPLVKRGWFWGVVAGAAVVVGGAVTLGVVLGQPQPPAVTLGSVKAN